MKAMIDTMKAFIEILEGMIINNQNLANKNDLLKKGISRQRILRETLDDIQHMQSTSIDELEVSLREMQDILKQSKVSANEGCDCLNIMFLGPHEF